MTDDLHDLIETRLMTPDDLPFVADSWRHSARRYCPRWRRMRRDRYRAAISSWIESKLAEHGAIVAVYRDRPSYVLGWACASRAVDGRPVVWFVYTLRVVRRMGLATRLLLESGCRPDVGAYYVEKRDRLRPPAGWEEWMG